MVIALTTPRLVIRTFLPSDLAVYAELNADPVVMEYLGKPLTRAQSDEMAAAADDSYARIGFGLLALERRADGAFLGMCGLGYVPWYPDDVEIGWRLAPKYWGNGYATEAATAWLNHAFGPLALRRVISVADVPNERSHAVMRRLGMTLDHEAELDDDGERFRAYVFAITADDWAAARHRLVR